MNFAIGALKRILKKFEIKKAKQQHGGLITLQEQLDIINKY